MQHPAVRNSGGRADCSDQKGNGSTKAKRAGGVAPNTVFKRKRPALEGMVALRDEVHGKNGGERIHP
jgi:hypothetical protein